MKKESEHILETIAAIATPLGEGAISVVRVSGESAVDKMDEVFRSKHPLAEAKSHTAHFGRIVDKAGNVIDEVVCTVYLDPHSYTGENTVEINCHGGIFVTGRVMQCILETGVRPAKPGEFTERAFLNGKLDLSQAEAVADLIRARSDKAHRISLDQLEGSISRKIHSIRNKLVESVGLLELELDFIEENIELIDNKKIDELIRKAIKEIDQLIDTYKFGKVLREGIRVALVGVPNAGKSSLLNTLLSEERSIVTDVPGTTRDFIEEKMAIKGILFRIVDTAGLRKTKNRVEQEGVKRTWKVIENSDIVVIVHDSTKLMEKEEKKLLVTLNKKKKKIVIVNNKIDLLKNEKKSRLAKTKNTIINASMIDHRGVEELKNLFSEHVTENKNDKDGESITITNERHYSSLLKAKAGLTSTIQSLENGESEEFIAVNLRSAIDSIGEIIGLVTTEDILQNIFSRFCIGK